MSGWGPSRLIVTMCACFALAGCDDDTTEIADASVDQSTVDAGTTTIPKRPSGLSVCVSASAQLLGTITELVGGLDGDAGVGDAGADAGTTGGVLGPEELREISGLTASRKQPGVLWVHDDSGNEPNVYAINTAGALLGVFRLQNVALHDWEDIAIGPGPDVGVDYIYVGDIGDGARDQFAGSDRVIYRIPEPTVSSTTPPTEVAVTVVSNFDTLPVDYPAGFDESDANALFVDPDPSNRNPDIFVISTGNGITEPNRLFRLRDAQAASATTLELLFSLYAGDAGDPEITGADISADGTKIVLRSSKAANLWERSGGMTIEAALEELPCDAPIPAGDADSEEGGAIGFSATGDGYYTTIEGKDEPAPLFFVPLTDS